MLSFLDGKFFGEVKHTKKMLESFGLFLAELRGYRTVVAVVQPLQGILDQRPGLAPQNPRELATNLSDRKPR